MSKVTPRFMFPDFSAGQIHSSPPVLPRDIFGDACTRWSRDGCSFLHRVDNTRSFIYKLCWVYRAVSSVASCNLKSRKGRRRGNTRRGSEGTQEPNTHATHSHGRWSNYDVVLDNLDKTK